ncbi:MAG: primosomal protein N' [Candidatus Saccharibacteria bacterium]
MHYYEVAPNKIIRLDNDTFTYSSEIKLDIGKIVKVEVGKKQIIGVIIKETNKPSYNTKPISQIIIESSLPTQLIKLSSWLSKYYSSPLANVLQTILPTGIDKKRKPNLKELIIPKRERTNIVFNEEQSSTINTLSKIEDGTFLLQGVTGSGKTDVYIEIAKQSINNGKSVIVLVPEIALTSQLISEFSNHFQDLIVTHSRMTESLRHINWLEALNSTRPRIVIGPRSALFSPLKNIGAIIIDEAHEPSYKQDQSPKYSALRAATILGRLHNAKVIFGSATPNIIDRYLAEKSINPIFKLTKVARKNSIPPTVTIVDMTKRDSFKKHRFLSDQLIEQIEKTIKLGEQVLIFHNRRGSTSTTLCKNCGWVSQCPKCFLPLTLHTDKNKLLCHICNHQSNIPTSCPQCGGTDIIYKGIGTKLIESELHKLFPKAVIARFDADNNEEEAINSRYDELYKGKIDIIIGTQIVAKGLDLPHLRTVGIIQADSGLSLPDFNSNERTFQLLSQVIGRVGRNEHQTQVIVQTYQPNHPSIINGAKQDYESFYKEAIAERQKGIFPPFTYLLKLTCVYKTENAAISNSKKLAQTIRNKNINEILILGPTPAFYERQHNTYRWQIIIKSPRREYLIDIMNLVPSTHWQYELDPTSLL